MTAIDPRELIACKAALRFRASGEYFSTAELKGDCMQLAIGDLERIVPLSAIEEGDVGMAFVMNQFQEMVDASH